VAAVWKKHVRLLGLLAIVFAGVFIDAQEKELPIVVVVPSYTNSQWYKANLDSIYCQKYTNYRVIYIDDCSPDGTGELVKAYVDKHSVADKTTLVHNRIRRGALANLYTAIHTCSDNEIVITVDGDDWLKHDKVFQRINYEYLHNDVWMTYGHYESYPDGPQPFKPLPNVVVARGIYREYDWCTSHLRTFYAGIFKQIKLQDLLYKGDFFDVTGDLAFMFPLLEMAGPHARPISDVLYVYNCATPLNDFKTKLVKQWHNDKVIRSRKRYTRLSSLSWFGKKEPAAVDICIFAGDDSVKTAFALERIKQYVQGDECITVLYDVASNKEGQFDYVQRQHDAVRFRAYTQKSCKNEVCRLLHDSSRPYVLFVSDSSPVCEAIDFSHDVALLQKTHACGMYYNLGFDAQDADCLARAMNTPPAALVEGAIYAWRFVDGEQAWHTPYAINAVLYKKSCIAPVIVERAFSDDKTLEAACVQATHDPEAIGLFFNKAKIRSARY